MHAIRRKWRHLRPLGVALFLSAGVAVGLGARQPQSLLDAFEARYQHFMQRVQGGELAPEARDDAKAIWLALRKDIITLDAEIETLKLEVMSQQGPRQQVALEQIGEKTTERERRLVRAIQELDRLAGNGVSATVPAVPAATATSKPLAADGDASEKTIIRPLNIEIELAPEDLSKGDME